MHRKPKTDVDVAIREGIIRIPIEQTGITAIIPITAHKKPNQTPKKCIIYPNLSRGKPPLINPL